ncbi:MAG: SHOCT domain-containing protein [Chloroflexi bacterium]|nr:SHOCT domain-containing protein [Chloroflexota bacterium]
MWWMMNGGWNWGWGLFGLLWMLVFWGGIIFVVVWAVRRLTEHPADRGAARPSPLDIARERYARGEITREQFEQLKRDLS